MWLRVGPSPPLSQATALGSFKGNIICCQVLSCAIKFRGRYITWCAPLLTYESSAGGRASVAWVCPFADAQVWVCPNGKHDLVGEEIWLRRTRERRSFVRCTSPSRSHGFFNDDDCKNAENLLALMNGQLLWVRERARFCSSLSFVRNLRISVFLFCFNFKPVCKGRVDVFAECRVEQNSSRIWN